MAAVYSVPLSSTPAPLDPVGGSARRTPSICLWPVALSWKEDNSSPTARSSRRRYPCARFFQRRRPASTALHPICCTTGSGPPAAPVFPPPPSDRPSRNSSRQCETAPPPKPPAPRAAAALIAAPVDPSDISAGMSETLPLPFSRAYCRGPLWPFRCSWPSPPASARRQLPAGTGKTR